MVSGILPAGARQLENGLHSNKADASETAKIASPAWSGSVGGVRPGVCYRASARRVERGSGGETTEPRAFGGLSALRAAGRFLRARLPLVERAGGAAAPGRPHLGRVREEPRRRLRYLGGAGSSPTQPPASAGSRARALSRHLRRPLRGQGVAGAGGASPFRLGFPGYQLRPVLHRIGRIPGPSGSVPWSWRIVPRCCCTASRAESAERKPRIGPNFRCAPPWTIAGNCAAWRSGWPRPTFRGAPNSSLSAPSAWEPRLDVDYRETAQRRLSRPDRRRFRALRKAAPALCRYQVLNRDPVVHTRRLCLRPMQEEHREPFAAMNADPAVMEFFPRTYSRGRKRRELCPHPETLERSRLRHLGGRNPGSVRRFPWTGARPF